MKKEKMRAILFGVLMAGIFLAGFGLYQIPKINQTVFWYKITKQAPPSSIMGKRSRAILEAIKHGKDTYQFESQQAGPPGH